jgi:TRAP-type mannitol/chloroaromatic compound transport system substrate-binding protein
MDRRTFIGRAAVIAAGAGAAACGAEDGASGVAAPNINRRRTRRLRMVTTWPAGFPGLGTAARW